MAAASRCSGPTWGTPQPCATRGDPGKAPQKKHRQRPEGMRVRWNGEGKSSPARRVTTVAARQAPRGARPRAFTVRARRSRRWCPRKRIQEQVGGKVIGNYVTMGQYDQIAITEAPDDETVAKMALMIAGRGNAISETLRGFSMDEVRKLV